MIKKIALINPGKNKKFAIQEPLNLGFIASYLEKRDIKVSIIDELAGQNVEKEIEKYRPHIVGITATTPLAPDAYRIANYCKAKGILTVMGGVHAAILPEEALQFVDIVVSGEGEEVLFDIIKNDIKSGIVSRPYIKNIDAIPSPSRHLMQMDFYMHTKDRSPETYLYFVPKHTRVAAMLTSRGCPYDCIFCHNSWKGTPYRFNSPERVLCEIKELIKNYGIQAIFFIEDNFFANKSRVRNICELIIKENINIIWGANSRVDGIDLNIVRTAKEAGCRQITFGFESGSQKILDILNKKTTIEQNKKAIDICNEAGIIPQGTVMIGNPTETVEDIQLTQKFIKESDIKSLGACITTPFPGSRLWDWCKDHNLLPEKLNWSEFDYSKVVIPACDTISPEEIQRLHLETCKIINQKKPLKLNELLYTILTKPKSIINVFTQPSKILSIIKKLGSGKNL